MANKHALDLDAARRLLLATLSPIDGSETLALLGAFGRVLDADVVAPIDVPAHDNSAMDGYALRHADLAAGAETRLTLIGSALAGHAYAGSVGPGQALRIMTGAVLPSGADTVVMQECVRREGDAVFIPGGQTAGANVRRAGEDLARGSAALPAGKRLGAAEIGLLASLGIDTVRVRRRLRVAFFSTGDEITAPGRPLAAGEIYDSNRYTLHGALARLGVELIDLGIVRDDPGELERTLDAAARQADAIITSGGVSVGDADFVREIMARRGSINFWKLNIKPGKPFAFGRYGETWLFGLPGNPVSAMVTFEQLVVDALARLMGCDPLPARPQFTVRTAAAIGKSPGRREFMRGVLFEDGGEWRVRLTGSQGSGILSSMSQANCYVVLPEDCAGVAAGEPVDVEPFAAWR